MFLNESLTEPMLSSVDMLYGYTDRTAMILKANATVALLEHFALQNILMELRRCLID